ncbi:hypothetical protein A0H81_14820 [Grifola frondosa]|uniref:T6SS Phospholipase effector Tle1-like catalytic domain-containing protein n=1 Tax=Grifola frondosa TaxID=5627 RepID=A0A1C7LKK3_GRIFR|nr:hypothetical protein A0H81_14820 [Grifola frondosa]
MSTEGRNVRWRRNSSNLLDLDLGPDYATSPLTTLVLCFDGTGDQFDSDNSINVVQFFSMLKKGDRQQQMVYYQAGIGTYTVPEMPMSWVATSSSCKITKPTIRFACSASLAARILRALSRTNDSQGWFIARMQPPADSVRIQDVHQSRRARLEAINRLQKGILHGCRHRVHRSVGYCFKANLYNIPTEHEAQLGTQPGDMPKTGGVHKSKHSKRASLTEQEFVNDSVKNQTNVLEVWFAGCHCDIGGSSVSNETKNNLARIPLRWMIDNRRDRPCDTAPQPDASSFALALTGISTATGNMLVDVPDEDEEDKMLAFGLVVASGVKCVTVGKLGRVCSRRRW